MFGLVSVITALAVGTALAAPANPSLDSNSLSKRATSFWYANVDHTGQYRGYTPDIDDDNYAVFKAVNAGDGASLQEAITSTDGGNRHGQWLASQPRVYNCLKIPPHMIFSSRTAVLAVLTAENPKGCLYPTWNVRN